MVKHESRKNKPILLVGNGINKLFDKESDYFDVDSLLEKSKRTFKECNGNSDSLRFPMKISAMYNGNEVAASKDVKEFLEKEVY